MIGLWWIGKFRYAEAMSGNIVESRMPKAKENVRSRRSGVKAFHL